MEKKLRFKPSMLEDFENIELGVISNVSFSCSKKMNRYTLVGVCKTTETEHKVSFTEQQIEGSKTYGINVIGKAIDKIIEEIKKETDPYYQQPSMYDF